jgi:hypothetical protein
VNFNSTVGAIERSKTKSSILRKLDLPERSHFKDHDKVRSSSKFHQGTIYSTTTEIMKSPLSQNADFNQTFAERNPQMEDAWDTLKAH